MPKGLKRFYGTGELHYITCSCYRRKAWLGTGRQRDLLLEILEEVRQQHRFVVLGYVVMPEHFHLLMSEPQVGDPSTAMQSVKQRFARRVVPRHRQRRPAGTRPLQKTQGAGHHSHSCTRSLCPFGSHASTISMFGQCANEWRSCATCTAIR